MMDFVSKKWPELVTWGLLATTWMAFVLFVR